MIKQDTLFSAVVNFINSYKIGETYTSEDFCNALNDITRKKNQHKKWNGQFYRIRSYQTYLSKSAGFITNVKRGIWRINYHVPDWMSLYALETLRGYKDGYWNGREYVKKDPAYNNDLKRRLEEYKAGNNSTEEAEKPRKRIMTCVDVGSYRHLTNGKEYQIVGEEDGYYHVINENGDEVHMFKWRFTEKEIEKTWKVGDTLPAKLLNNYPHNFYGYDSDQWVTKNNRPFVGDRVIEEIKIVKGRLAALISGTANLWIEVATIGAESKEDRDIIEQIPTDRLPQFLEELEILIAKYK